jgi:ADP-ribose pyrophosphatase YjhB (NUDIX family)
MNPQRRSESGKLLFTVGAFAVVLDEHGSVLLGRRKDNGFWTLPGGAVEDGETPWQAVVRETREETGFEVEVVRLATVDWKQAASDIVFVFECRIRGGAAVTSDETSEVRFVPKDELAALLPRRIVERIDGVVSGAPTRLVDTRTADPRK